MILPFQKKGKIKHVDCEPITQVSKHVQDITTAATAPKKKGLLQLLFPSRTQRAVIRGEVQLIDKQYQTYCAALDLMSRGQLERLDELQYQFLSREQVQGRLKVVDGLINSRGELSQNLRQVAHGYMRQFNEDYTRAMTIQDPQMRDACIAQIRDEFTGFLDLQKRLLREVNEMISSVLMS